MRISLTASLFLAFLGLIRPVDMLTSGHPEDLEGSGYDIDDSGSGDWSRQGERKNIKDQPINKDVKILQTNARGGTKNTLHDSSDSSDNTQWITNDNGAEFVVANGKSFMERTDIFAAVIAGGVAGVILAAALWGMIIYKWQKTDDGGYILGQQRAPDKDDHISNREDVV